MGLPNPSRETKFSGANGHREILIFPVQLTTSRIGNLIRLIHFLAMCDDHTYCTGQNLCSFQIPTLEDPPRKVEECRRCALCTNTVVYEL